MSFSAVFALAVALAMDAFAVALSAGLCHGRAGMGRTLRLAGVFGAFQFLMPVCGWVIGSGAQRYIQDYDHWLAFALLVLVGGRMIHEACKGRDPAQCDGAVRDPTKGFQLLLLGIATSIDALAVGLTLAVLDYGIWMPALVIGLVCFGLTAIGMQLGCLARRLPFIGGLGTKANALGGVVLLAIAFKILHDHGVFC